MRYFKNEYNREHLYRIIHSQKIEAGSENSTIIKSWSVRSRRRRQVREAHRHYRPLTDADPARANSDWGNMSSTVMGGLFSARESVLSRFRSRCLIFRSWLLNDTFRQCLGASGFGPEIKKTQTPSKTIGNAWDRLGRTSNSTSSG